MHEEQFSEEQDIKELLKQYHNLKNGKSFSFLEEDAFERIIDYFDEQEDIAKALEAAEIGLEYFPFSSGLMIKQADLLIASRKYIEALDVLENAELFDKNNINIYILKTDAFLALDRQEKAVEILEEALLTVQGEEKIDLLFELADVYDDYEDFQKVFDCLKLILEEEPTNEEALYKICFWADFTGRNEESIQLHQQIIDKHPYNELAWFNLATAYQGLKLYEKAIDAYQYAIAIEEKFDYAYRNMGDAYIRLRKYKEAIDCLEKVLELARPEEVIYEAIGHCYHKLHDFAQARFNYRKASHMNPDDSKLHYKIALTYMDENQFETAVKPLEKAMLIHRNVPEYNLAMGECYLYLEDYKSAIQYFGNVIRLRPKNVNGWELFIRCLYLAEMYEEAAHQCVAALNATNGKSLFNYFYSACLLKLAKPKEALLQLEMAMDHSPKLVKKLIELDAALLQNSQVVDLIARYKKNKRL